MTQAMRAAPPARMSYEEFLNTDFEELRVEWVDGEIEYMGTVSREHSDLETYLVSLIRFYIEACSLGIVFIEPFNMKLKAGHKLSGRNPDILFVANDHRDRIQKNHLDGPADLVIEIVGPDDPSRDRVEKFAEYEQGGVLEYWILDPETHRFDFFLLGEDGRYHLQQIGDEGIYRSAMLAGLWLKVDWLSQKPLPPLMDVLRAWKLIP